MLNKAKNKNYITLLIVLGILFTYTNQMALSPIMSEVRQAYSISNEALLNLSMTIMYPTIIIFSLWGSSQKKIDTRSMYTLCLLITGIGMGICFFAKRYWVLILSRLVFGAGFGLGIPFIGNAISDWYEGKEQETMNTLNGLFPLIGTLITFVITVPLCNLFNNDIKATLGIWGIPYFVIMILWLLLSKPQSDQPKDEEEEDANIKDIFSIKDVVLLCVAFVCDFFCYSYIATILPDFLNEAFLIGPEKAGIIAAVAFPAVGVFGGSIGGSYMSKTRLRKPSMLIGQLLKFVGLVIAAVGANMHIMVVVIGIMMFGIGNSMWMPGMYMVAMEQPGMNAKKTGIAFSVISSCGFAAGFISPIIGGFVTDLLIKSGISYTASIQICIAVYSITNLVAYFAIKATKETGKSTKDD